MVSFQPVSVRDTIGKIILNWKLSYNEAGKAIATNDDSICFL